MAGSPKDLLLSYDCPDDWAQYIRLIQRLDSKLHQREAEKKKETTNTPSRANASASSTTSAPTPHIPNNLAYLGPAPMDLSAAQKQAEREHIYQERHAEASASTAEEPATSALPAHAASGIPWPWQKPPSRLHCSAARRPQRWEKTSPMPPGWHRFRTSRISLIFCLLSEGRTGGRGT